jgi:hypothetical protein
MQFHSTFYDVTVTRVLSFSALDVQKAMGDTVEPLKPHHVHLAVDNLRQKGKLYPPFGSRKSPFD